MASSFLKRKAQAQAQKIDDKYGAAAYGGSASLRSSTTTTNGGGNGAPVTRASDFLTRKAQERAASIDENYGSGAYGGSEWTVFDKEQGLNSWMDSVNQFSDRMTRDFDARNKERQSVDSFGKYRDDAFAEIAALEGRANTYRSYFENNRDRYDAEALDEALRAIGERQEYLAGVRDDLTSEYDYWVQLAEAEQQAQPRDASLYDMTIGSIKRGYDNAVYGRELYKQMTGQENEADEYAEKMQGDDYNFEAKGWRGAISGAAELIGQQVRQWTDPLSIGLAGTAAGGAFLAGQAGPQVLVPEEVITVPGAALAGLQVGSTKANFEIEAGHAYQELLDNGVSEETARAIATGVGVGNAALEFVQLDELAKSFKVLDKIGADDSILGLVKKELARRGVDVAKETVQEVAQEGVTIAGTQIGSKLDKGEWAYGADDVLSRLGDTALSSALSFGVLNVPGGVHNVYQQAAQRGDTGPSSGPSAPQSVPTSTAEALLTEAAEQVAQGGTISGKMADRILASEEAVAYLQQAGVLDLSDGMKQTERRAAVKSAVGGLASRSAATERTEAGTDTQGQRDALMRAIGDGQRVDYDALTEEQTEAWNSGHEDVWVDAEQKVYQMDPEQHISQRTMESVTSRKVKAFQFDHPELRGFYQQAASDLIKDASLSLDQPRTGRFERTTQGKRYIQSILETPSLRYAMDMGLTRVEIIKAAEALLADHGQENYAAAKRLEFVLDDMLTEGYTTVEGDTFGPNESYIRAVQNIPGYQVQEREELPIWDTEEPAAQTTTGQAPTLRTRNDAELVHDIRQVQRAATALGENGSRALAAVYDADMARYYDPQDVTESFFQVYNAALNGEALTEEAEQRAAAMPEHLRLAAQSAAEQDTARAEQAKHFGEKAGLVRDANWKKAHLSSKTSRVLDALGKVLGVEVRFAETVNDGQANAQYENGVITIALDAQDPVLTSLVHEVVHRVRETSPAAYQTIADFVRQNMTEEGLDFNLAQRARLYKTTDADYLTEEMVADAFGQMLGNEEIMGRFAQEHRSLAQRIRDVLSDIVNAIKRVLRRQNLKLTQAQWEAFRDLEGKVSAMERAFSDALKEAESAQTQAQKNTAAQQDGDAKFSIKRTKGMTLAAQLKAFYDGKLRSSDALYFGETPEALNAAGLDALPLVFTQADFKKSTKGKHNVPRRVIKNLNKDLETALFAFRDGDRVGILTGDIDGDGKPLLVGIERNVTMDWQPVNAIRSAYGLDNPGEWLKNQINAGKNFSLLDENRANTFLLPYGYLASRGEGIRSTGESVTQDGGEVKEKFSLKSPVERAGNLIALHNMDGEKIDRTLSLGAWPAPSIAIVQASQGHSSYGEYSAVFRARTIDPQADSRNRVYGSDAWTPTHNQTLVESEVDYGKKREFERLIEDLSWDIGGGAFNMGSVLSRAGIDDTSKKSIREIAEQIAKYPDVQAAYLATQGEDVEVQRREKSYHRFGNEAVRRYTRMLTIQELAALDMAVETRNQATIEAAAPQVKQAARDAYEEVLRNRRTMSGKPISEEVIQLRLNKYVNDITDYHVESFIQAAWEMTQDGANTGEIDRQSMAQALNDRVDKRDVALWAEGLLDGLLVGEGIYNGVDIITDYGRRDFAETHVPVTAENLVEAMYRENGSRGIGAYAMEASGLQSAASPSYRTVEDIRADSHRLGKVPDAEMQALKDEIDERLSGLYEKLDALPGASAYNISDAVINAAGLRYVDDVIRSFEQDGIRAMSEDTALELIEVFEMAAQLPTEYFEAKPERVVPFNEALAVVSPDDAPADRIKRMQDAGMNIIFYKAGNEADRLAKVNSVEGARFSLKKDSQGRELTAQQQSFFKGSKAVDADGRLLVMYHGTRKGGFTVFRGWSYLTANKDYASKYVDRDTGETMYEVYANIKAPFDTRLKECRDLFDSEYTGNYSNTPLQDSGLPDWTDGYDLVDFIEENDYGYDAILLDEGADPGTGERIISYVVRNPEQIKSVDNASPTSDPDIRYSRSNRDILDAYVREYGEIPRGEKPSREIVMPKKTAGGKKLSQTVRTVLEAGATPEEMVPSIEKLAAKGDFSYDTYTDKQAIADADARIRRIGWGQALSDWMNSMKRGEVSKANTAMGWALYNNAANTGDTETAITILEKMVEHQRSAAQALQATRILKKLSPETQLYGVQRSVANLQEELNEQFGEKGGPELKIDQDLAERFMRAKDQEARDEIMKDIYRDIGRQMPSRFRDKWNAWRYLAMLGNPRTHVRNVVGNAGFAPVVAAKDMTATAIEAVVSRLSGGKLERSKAFVGFGKKGRALLSAAWGDYAKVQETSLSGGKYSDFANANKYVEEGRRIFKTKPLEAARKANSAALDAEDVWFSKPHYAYALAQYCKAHGITPEQIASGKGIKQARAYAILEAQKATYRDTNALSQTIGELGRSVRPGKNTVRKGVGLVMEGILPFRKTPANILARGVEYSPIGLMNGIKQAVWDVQKGRKSGAEAIDSISAGMTGTGLLALGVWLAAQGLVRGHGGDDEDEIEMKELMGHQAYALELPNGKSVTLDWLAPEALPFFVGVNLWEQTGGEQEEVTLSSILSAVTTVSEPMLEMSCLQSLNDVFDAVGYASSEGLDGLPAALASAATSYLTQALPTVLGQAERTVEGQRMTTYTEKNAFLTGDMQYTLGRASARLPGVDYQQIPYIDAWGRVEQSGNTGARAFNNFLNPAYTSSIHTSEMEEELLRLYRATGEGSVLPSRARKYFTVDKERKDLTAEEYVEYATLKGQTSYELVTELTQSSEYQRMSDEEKVKAVKDAYDLANQTAKEAVSNYAPDAWVGKAAEAEKKYGISQETYITLKTQAAGIQSLKDADGGTITNSKGLQIMEMVYNTPGLTDKQRAAMFEYLGVGKTVMHYNKALVKEKLAQMRKQAG